MGVYTMRTCQVRELATAMRDGDLRPVGGAGGPTWNGAVRTALMTAVERHWPIGPLVAWRPTREVAYLLDGHRRVATITATDHGDALVRDLDSVEALYTTARATVSRGAYLPVSAMAQTISFLTATRGLSPETLDRAHTVARDVLAAPVDMLTITTAHPVRAAEICGALLPGRVDVRLLEGIATSHLDGGAR